MPDEDWKSFMTALIEAHKDDVDKPICSYFNNLCYFDKMCADLTASDNHLKITITDSNGATGEFDIDEKDLRVQGSEMGMAGDKG